MPYSIDKIHWDSSFFGLSIGKLVLNSGTSIDEMALKVCAKDFDLVYLFTSGLLNFGLLNQNIQLVDTKIVFKKAIEAYCPAGKLILFDPTAHSYASLLELALLSGTYSRFKIDSKFPSGSFEKLYKRWVDNSIEMKNEQVIVTTANKELTGFVSVEVNNIQLAKIGLIAVHTDFQGQGLGSELLRQAENLAKDGGSPAIQVVTQERNKAAMNLYQKNNYIIAEKIYIYHYWVQ